MTERQADPREIQRGFSQIVTLQKGSVVVLDETVGIRYRALSSKFAIPYEVDVAADRSLRIIREKSLKRGFSGVKHGLTGVGIVTLGINTDDDKVFFAGKYRVVVLETREEAISLLLESPRPISTQELSFGGDMRRIIMAPSTNLRRKRDIWKKPKHNKPYKRNKKHPGNRY